jgi:uncharacterized membrane protein YdfJ with MMPL/SSD domain
VANGAVVCASAVVLAATIASAVASRIQVDPRIRSSLLP